MGGILSNLCGVFLVKSSKHGMLIAKKVNFRHSCSTLKILKIHSTLYWFVLFVCCFTSQVNRSGHGRTVSSPNHTFFLGKLEQAIKRYFVHILSLVTYNNPS